MSGNVVVETRIVEHVPCADHDARIHNIVTEKRVIDCPAVCRLMPGPHQGMAGTGMGK